MTIERVIGGVIYEFPDGTPEAKIRQFEATKTGRAPSPAAGPAAVPTATRPKGFSDGIGSQALQGLTFGFSDEIVAGLRSAMGQGKYEDLVKAERDALRKYSEEHPVLSGAAEIAGGVAPAILTGGASLFPAAGRAVTKTLGPRAAQLLFGTQPTVGRMAATGAGAGAVSAVGTSEQPLSEQPVEAAKGAVAGAATAGALGVVGKYAVVPAFRSIKAAMGYGDANKAADIAIAKALAKDGIAPDEISARIAAMARGEMTLADFGENTAALLRRASAAPGETRRFVKGELAGREMERVPRVSEDLRTLMSGSKDFYTDVQDLIKKRSAEGNALYEAAWASKPTFSPATAPDIDRLRNLPSFKKAMEQGAKRMEDKGLDITDPANTLRALHETKIALDDMIESAMRTGETNQARTLISMKERLLADMEKASPEYRVARQTFAGDSELLTAMNEGRNIYTMPEMDMRKLIERFKDSPSEYDAFRAGISQAILERLKAGGAGADPSRSIFPRGSEEKIRRAFRDDDAFNQFKARLAEEQTMLNTEKAGFRKLPIDTDLDAAASGVGAATNLLQGRPVAAALEAARTRFPSLGGMPPGVAAPTAQKLLTPADQTDDVVRSIMQSLKEQEAQLLQATGVTGGLAAGAGAIGAARGIKEQYPEEGSLAGPGMQPPNEAVSPLQSVGQ